MRGRRLTALLVAGGTLIVCGLVAEWVTATPASRDRVIARILRSDTALPPDLGALTPVGDLGNVHVRVIARASGTAISPLIYGVAGADPGTLAALGATVNRWGGNPSSRYNWVNGHAWNAGRDWHFANVNYGDSTASQSDLFMTEAGAAGVAALMTVPAIGWVARDDDNQNRSRGVPASGGAAVSAAGAIAGYDPSANRARTSVQSLPRNPGPMAEVPNPDSPVVYQDEWVHHLVARFGRGARYFAIDNEPDLWAFTHTDVHPAEPGYADVLSNFEAYADAVRSQDPDAVILGPSVSGWTGYFYSSLDRGNDNFATHADRSAHSGTPFLPWWLAQVAQADRQAKRRTLNLLDVHYYPQAPNVTSDASDPQTQALRIRSTRSLWDPTYTDESWIGTEVGLVPRLRDWIDHAYPGTGIALSEYRWGGKNDPSGAVAQALVLGHLGRLGVTLACYWTYPPPSSFPGAAFRLYRNYDGKGAHFGDRSLPAAADASAITVFAARDSQTNDLDVIIVNGASAEASVRIDLGQRVAGPVAAYRVADRPEVVRSEVADLGAPLPVAPMTATLLHVRAAQLP